MPKLDDINDRILHELARDARISNAELATRVGLSPSACLRRVQDLERSGVITGYRAVLNRPALGVGFTGAVEYLLRVEVADLAAYKAFHTDLLGTLPHVAALTTYVVMGSPKDERG